MKKAIFTASAILAGLALSGCGDDNLNPFNPGNPVIPIVLAPPTAVNDAYNDTGNAQLTIAAPGVLANDTPNQGTITAFQQASAQGGTVALNADDSFTYTPRTGFVGTDTFTYTLTNSGGSSTATVTIMVSGMAFFVNNTATAGGNGSQAAPFNTLSAAVAAAAGVNGAQIIVMRGDGTSNGLNTQVNLSANETLKAFDANRPVLTGPIVLANGATVSGIQINASPVDAISGTGVSGVTIQNVLIAAPTGSGILLTNPTGTVTLTGNTINNAAQRGISIAPSAGALTVALTNNTVSSPQFDGISLNQTGTANVNWIEQGTNLSGAGAAGLNLGSGWLIRIAGTSAFNSTVTSSTSTGASLIGYDFGTGNSSTAVVVMTNSTITNGADRGVNFVAADSSNAKARFSSDSFLGNLAGLEFEAISDNTATMGLRFTNDQGGTYTLSQLATSTFRVENLVNFSSENTGNLMLQGNVQNAAVGSLGIP